MERTEQEKVRINKLNNIAKHMNPYPDKFEFSHTLKEAKILEDEVANVSVAGRIVFIRNMGKMAFIMIRDIEEKLQISLKMDILGEDNYNFFTDNYDLGDFIGAKGEMFTTHTGEKTVRAETITFLGKALKPLPEKFHGLSDVELCYRNRYVDLIMNEETRKRFLFKFEFVKMLRRYLEDLGYIEIETPVFINKPSGALAKPFISHHNALDLDVYLRIAPETYLKRAIIGGFTKIFEVARCFRNEGMDSTHLQDFTMIEGYGAYLNYKDNMKLLKDMLCSIIENLFGTLKITIAGNEIDLSKEWEEVSFKDLILRYIAIDIDIYDTKEKLLQKIKDEKIDIDTEIDIKLLGYGNLVDQLYKKVARPNVLGPTFLVGHPLDLSPLARKNDDNPKITDRFQLLINGAEIINAYSELVDPIDQKERLEKQAKLNQGGDTEAMMMDNEYIEAMEYGMPPISGWGIGLDRIVQLLVNAENVKDCVLFPLMRPIEK